MEGFILRRAVTFFTRSGEPASASLILTLFLAACSSAGIRTRLLSSKSSAEVVIKTSRFASWISSRRREIMFERPLREPVISWDFTSEMPVLCIRSSSIYSGVSLIVTRFLTRSFASCTVLILIFSITSVGFTEMYFTGLPIFVIANPRFSNDSRTSYVRERGTPESSATSPAEATPFERSAIHTFVS